MLVTIGKASHADQIYFLCSDVVIGGGGVTPTTPAPTASVPVTTTTPRPTTTTAPTPISVPTTVPVTTVPGTTPTGMPGGNHGCTATHSVVGSWQGGLQALVMVTAGSSAINNWHVMWTNPSGQVVTQVWNGTVAPDPASTMVDSESYNGRLAAGQTATFGLLASWTGAIQSPSAISCIAG